MDNRPIFHIVAKNGWINDPNGLVKFKGKYHIFFQHHPYSCQWGPMHWGHVISDDLLHFEYLPYALTPGDKFDKDGCFSGTALVEGDTLYIAYTGFINNEDPEKIKQIQCLASSKDGIHFVKHGCIIDERELPKQYKPTDFRDPKLIKKGDKYYIFVAAKKYDGGGSILLFESANLKDWKFVNDVLNHESEGKMIECADYHEDLGLLLYSEQDFPSDNPHCLNIHSCEYEIGELDKDFKFISKEGKKLVDFGFDFYAPQIIDDGHYLIAWLNMWDRNNPSEKYGFAGSLTVPRKVEVKDNLMLQTPLIYGKLVKKTNLEDEYIDYIDVGVIKLELEDLKSLDISLREGKDEITKFYLKDNEFYFDRSKSGEKITGAEKDELSLKGIRKMPYRKLDKGIIYIVLDKYSVEIFVNGISMSNLIYPKENSNKLTLKIVAKKKMMEMYK